MESHRWEPKSNMGMKTSQLFSKLFKNSPRYRNGLKYETVGNFPKISLIEIQASKLTRKCVPNKSVTRFQQNGITSL